MNLYCATTTIDNGKVGHQKSEVYVFSENGELLFHRPIGDYTANQAEVLAIVAALKYISPGQPKEIFTNSQIASSLFKDRENPKKMTGMKTKKNKYEKFEKIAEYAISVWAEHSMAWITWVPAKENLARFFLKRHRYK